MPRGYFKDGTKMIPPKCFGRAMSQKTKDALHNALFGKKLSKEHRFKSGNGWRGKKRPKFSEEWKRNISEANKGRHHTTESKLKIGKSNRGKHHSEETKKKLSIMRRGAKGSNWKGGVTSEHKSLRAGIEFRLWREAVFARDNYTCQKTKNKGGELHPHHIKNFAQYPKLRFIVDNGITFSKRAHKEFHKKYGRKNNTKAQVKEFLEGYEIPVWGKGIDIVNKINHPHQS